MLVEDTNVCKEVALNQLKDQLPWQKVKITGKVLEIGDTSKLEGGRQVQQVLVADSTATAELALWQDFVDILSLGKSYKLSNLAVKVFNERATLFTPKQNVDIKEIEDLNDVVSPVKSTKNLQNVKVIAVSVTSGHVYISCKAGYVKPMQTNVEYGKCTDCPTTVLIKTCKFKVSALLTLSYGGFQIKLSARDDTLASIAQLPLTDVTDLSLLAAPAFTVVYNMAILEISR